MAFDYSIDYAQKAIDLVKSGAPDHLVVAALANREKKIADLSMGEDKAGSTSALKTYLAALSTAIPGKTVQPAPVEQPAQLDYSNSTMGPIDFNSDSFGFIPSSYAAPGGSSLNAGTIVGYVIVGLVGIVVLDKLLK
jgi:hypothetical protein